MKTKLVFATFFALFFIVGTVQASRVAGIPPPKASQAYKPPPGGLMLSGVVTEVDTQGAKVQIDGKWLTVKPGRTQFLRGGLPVSTSALSKGLKLRFSMASQAAGEMALGVVYVP